MENDADTPDEDRGQESWRGPTIVEIAAAANVGTATVDRVLNARGRVRESTRKTVLDALAGLRNRGAHSKKRKIAFLTESGVSFNRSLEAAVEAHAAAREQIDFAFSAVPTAEVKAVKFAQLIERTAGEADGLVVVAREDLSINRAIRAVTSQNIPVVCVTTDLPNSGRTAYVGSDQISAGAAAAYMMGRLVGGRAGKILLVVSAPYRCQEEREVGFRRVLRSEFPNLFVEERVNSKDETDHSYRNVRKYIAEHGPPAGVYNVAAGNLGIARALEEAELQDKVVFIGHELNPNSRMLLESGVMDFAIAHDLDREIAQSVEAITAHLEGRPLPDLAPSKVRIYTKYTCD